VPSDTAPSTQEILDAELIARARIGQVEAFAELYDRHAPRVLAVARRILGDACEAEDLLHDVFLESWQCVRDYDPTRGGVLTWLLVRTRSRAADRMARRSRERQARQLIFERELDSNPPLPTAESELATRTALARLESPLRMPLELMYVAGLTASEISVQIGVAEGTVRSRVARGLSQLERVLR
jgi:RNA polymerase sigma-70 factor (ECF subfamily)